MATECHCCHQGQACPCCPMHRELSTRDTVRAQVIGGHCLAVGRAKHAETVDAFVREMECAKHAYSQGERVALLQALMRANGAVAQGLVWSEVLGDTGSSADWLRSMERVQALLDRAMGDGYARLFLPLP